MNTEPRHPPSRLKSFQEALARRQQEHDNFCVDALLIHAWLGQLMVEAAARYAERKTPKRLLMQTGQAQRGFLQIFGNVQEHELYRLLQSLHRFTESDNPLAAILFRALLSLSAEHESAGDFFGTRGPDLCARPLAAALWMRESLERWWEWVDAFIHFQTHSQWHLAPECFDPDPQKRELAALAVNQRFLAQIRAAGKADWRAHHTGEAQGFTEDRKSV